MTFNKNSARLLLEDGPMDRVGGVPSMLPAVYATGLLCAPDRPL